MPIADVELVMMASTAVLAAQHFPREVDEWEGLPAVNRTWKGVESGIPSRPPKTPAPTTSARGGEPLRGAHSVLPAPTATIDRLGTALNNLALAAASTTPPSSSSSRLQTCHSPRQMPCSQRPTRSSWRLLPKSLQPRRALRDHLGLPTNRSLEIIVGLMATASVSITQVQHAVATPRATRTWPPRAKSSPIQLNSAIPIFPSRLHLLKTNSFMAFRL